jgi:hypothetical protein
VGSEMCIRDRLDAIDVDTGAILWTAKLDAPDFGGALVAGDLVFTSTFTG